MGNDSILSIFIDESGNFGDPNDPARLCIITFVFHDQATDISNAIRELNQANSDLGLDPERFQFHTSPLIRQDDEYAAMSRRMRARILDRMLTFIRHVDFRYACFSADTKFVNTVEQIADKLERQIVEFINSHQVLFADIESVKVYYDAGQKTVGRILESSLSKALPRPFAFAQGARQEQYKLLQVADFICTMRLIELRLESGQPLNHAETRFFGGLRDFKRNVLKKMKAKEI